MSNIELEQILRNLVEEVKAHLEEVWDEFTDSKNEETIRDFVEFLSNTIEEARDEYLHKHQL